jgi:hypothetical protein
MKYPNITVRVDYRIGQANMVCAAANGLRIAGEPKEEIVKFVEDAMMRDYSSMINFVWQYLRLSIH